MKYSERYKKDNKKTENIDLDFIKWIDMVETKVKTNTGYDLLDLPDFPYMIRYEDDVSPDEMVDEILSELYEL